MQTPDLLTSDRGPTGLPRSTAYELLGNERRRHVVEYVATAGRRSIPMADVVDYVTERENDCYDGEEQYESNEWKSVYVSLRQAHLPKLDEADVIDFDNPRGEVSPGAHLEDVAAHLHCRPERQRLWSHVSLGLAAVGLGFAGLSAPGVGIVGADAPLSTAALALAVGLSGLLQLLDAPTGARPGPLSTRSLRPRIPFRDVSPSDEGD